VNLPSTAGDMGVLANHVPIIAQLRPGTVEVLDGKAPKKFFGASAERAGGCKARARGRRTDGGRTAADRPPPRHPFFPLSLRCSERRVCRREPGLVAQH